MNVLLIGSGPHFHRYFDTLCFQKNISAIFTEPLPSFRAVDVLAITEPYSINDSTFELVEKIKDGAYLFLEKVPTLDLKRLDDLIHIAPRLNVFFVHSRLFDRRRSYMTGKQNHAVWTYPSDAGVDPILHVLPNIIDFCAQQTDFRITEQDVRLLSRCPLEIEFALGETTIVFQIVPSMENRVVVNDQAVHLPNYFETYSQMFEYAFSESADFMQNWNYARTEVNIVNKLLAELGV